MSSSLPSPSQVLLRRTCIDRWETLLIPLLHTRFSLSLSALSSQCGRPPPSLEYSSGPDGPFNCLVWGPAFYPTQCKSDNRDRSGDDSFFPNIPVSRLTEWPYEGYVPPRKVPKLSKKIPTSQVGTATEFDCTTGTERGGGKARVKNHDFFLSFACRQSPPAAQYLPLGQIRPA